MPIIRMEISGTVTNGFLPLTGNDLADTSKLIKIATELQTKFVKSEKKYKLISKNKTFYMRYPETIEKLAYVSYRFVRVLDNRLVLGNTDQMIITLGAGGKLKECRSSEPEYEPAVINSRAIVKPVAYEKILRMKQKEKDFESYKDGKLVEFEQFNIDDVTDAYYECMDAGKKIIVPHLAILLSYNDKNTKKSREAFLSLRAEDWANLSASDIEVYKNSNK